MILRRSTLRRCGWGTTDAMTPAEVFEALVALLPPEPSGDDPPAPDDSAAANGRERRIQPGWRRRAACRGLNPDLFHPPVGGTHQFVRAVAICGACPVRLECLAESMATPVEIMGVWGGMSSRERDGLRQRVRRYRRGQVAA